MAELIFPLDDSPIPDSPTWSKFFTKLRETGVIPGAGYLKVSPGVGLSVSVAPGVALVKGVYYELTTTTSLGLQTPDATNPRIDLVVVRIDFINGKASSGITVLTGTPAATPTPPTPQQAEGTLWELPLAEVYVAPSATGISASNITDRRTFAPAPRPVLLVDDTLTANTNLWTINIPYADEFPVLRMLIEAHGTRTADVKDAVDAYPNGSSSTNDVFSAILNDGAYGTQSGKWRIGTIATDGIADSRGPQAYGIISVSIYHGAISFPVMFAKNLRNTPGIKGNWISWGRFAQAGAIISSLNLQPLNASFKSGSRVRVWGLTEVAAW